MWDFNILRRVLPVPPHTSCLSSFKQSTPSLRSDWRICSLNRRKTVRNGRVAAINAEMFPEVMNARRLKEYMHHNYIWIMWRLYFYLNRGRLEVLIGLKSTGAGAEGTVGNGFYCFIFRNKHKEVRVNDQRDSAVDAFGAILNNGPTRLRKSQILRMKVPFRCLSVP